MAETIQEIAEPPDGRVLVRICCFGEDSRIGLFTQVVDGLRRPVDSRRSMEIAAYIEQSQFNARYLGEPRLRFQLRQPLRAVYHGKGIRQLVEELDLLPTDLDSRKLAWRNDLKDHRCLVGRPVKSRCAKQRDAVIYPQVLHEGINPTCRIGSANCPILRPHNQVKPPSRGNETALF